MTAVRKGKEFVELLLLESDSRRIQTLTTFARKKGSFRGADISDVACSGTIIAWVSLGGSIWLFDKAHDSRTELAFQSAPVYQLAFCPNGRGMLACTRDGSLVLWDLSTQTHRLVGICLFCMGMTVSPNGKQVATLGSSTGSLIQVWDLTIHTRGEMHDIPRDCQLLFAPSGGQIAGANVDPTISPRKCKEIYKGIWLQSTTNEQTNILLEHSQDVRWILSVSPDGRYIAAALSEDIVRLWDTETGKVTKTLSNCRDIRTLAFSSDGTKFASAGRNGDLCIWDFSNGLPQYKIKGQLYPSNMTFSLNGRKLVWAANHVIDDYEVTVWDAGTGGSLDIASQSIERLSAQSKAIAISPCGEYLAYQAQLNVVAIHNTNTKEERNLQSFYRKAAYLRSMAFAPDSKSVALHLSSDEIELWDVDTVQPIQIAPTHISSDRRIEFSANGEILVTNLGQFPIHRVDTNKRKLSRRSYWRYHDGWVMESSRRMLRLPPDINFGINEENLVHRDGLFAFWDSRHGIRYLGFTQDEVAMEDV
ncbi:MAG: hypothetical protein Q9200_002062 [Gallowayella weberi]